MTGPAGLGIFAASLLAGSIASVAGFGIGSLLTPLLALRFGTGPAVVLVSIPHAVATALRAWRLRRAIDWRVLRGFGIASAAGGLAGALLHARLANPALTIVFGALLVLAGIQGFLRAQSRRRIGQVRALSEGALSGAFGGLVGNQGGIRSAALLGYGLEPRAFVATATATGVVVDAARLPVYFATGLDLVRNGWPWIAVATVGVVAGTLAGEGVLRRLPAQAFKRTVSALLVLLGILVIAGLR